LSTIAPTAVQP